MKVVISLPDSLFQRAELFASLEQRPRSELYAAALQNYLERHEAASLTARLDALYADEDSQLDPEVAELGFEVLRRSKS